jgi:predicted TPR repeat methyltransferase
MESELERAARHFSEGVSHFEAGRLEAARSAFEQAHALAPARASVIGNLGITLFHLGHYPEAAEMLRRAVAADPEYGDAWTCLALCREKFMQWQEAIDALEQAARFSSQLAPLHFLRGQCLMQLGRSEEAAAAFDLSIAANPAHAEAWSAKGGALRDLLRVQEAANCFRQALDLGGDAELNNYYLASVTASPTPRTPPRRYVEALFDSYAVDFEPHVTVGLAYRGHEQLLQPLLKSDRQFARAIDLGCGTGLCGPLLKKLTESVDGVDISRAMLGPARARGIYRRLTHADIGAYLAGEFERADLVVAADVFIYVGELAEIFGEVRRILMEDGCFAFTVETLLEGEAFQLLPSLRYAHSEAYIRRLAQKSGFEKMEITAVTIRVEQGKPIPGACVYLA